jgi:chromate transporter
MVNIKSLLNIYLTFVKLGSVSFGGGYSMLSLMEREVVGKKKWVNHEKIIDIFAVSESLPGAIALNSSAFVGFSIAGVPGAIAALLGNLTSPVIIMLSMMILFIQVRTQPLVMSAFSGIYPAIVGLIAYAAYKIAKTAIKDVVCLVIMIASFCVSTFLHVPPIPIIASGAVAGIAITTIKSALTASRKSKSL